MKKRFALPLIALVLFVLMAAFATTAQATPSKTSQCSGCHDGVNVPVTATLASATAASTTYNVSAPGANAIAVFDGTTKLTTIVAASGQFTVANGKTYTVFSVKGPSTSSGLGQTTVSPTAPVDSTPPVTTSDAKTTYVSTATIKLTATDTGGSGVAATYYRLDGGLQTSGTTVVVSSLGAHTLEFWSVDVKGNTELHKTAAFTITAPPDTTPPVTTSDAKATYVATATIKLTATDASSAVTATYYKLDGGAQVAGTSITVNTVGAHTLEFWSVDAKGNIEMPHKTASFSITAAPDLTAPATTSDAIAQYTSTATIKLTATDTGGSGVAGTYYRLDGGAQVTGTTVTVSTIGFHTLEFWSADKSGNIETPHKTVSFSVVAPPDLTAPVTTSDAKPSYLSFASITLNATDAGSGVAATYYKLDGGAQVAGTSVYTIVPGAHTLEFWSVDTSANVEAHKTVSFNLTIDTTAPVTTSNAVATYYNTAAIKLTATDVGGTGVAHTYYVLDADPQAEGTTVNVSALGSHTLEFWSEDTSANVEAHKTVTFEVVERLVPPTPVYRFYNLLNGSHFYTASESERDAVLNTQASVYVLDGMAFTVNSLDPNNNSPLYRFYNKKSGSHFYTASAAEKAYVTDELDDVYSYDGPAYNVGTKPFAGAVTVWRFYNKLNGSHFYTRDMAEKANVEANLKAIYQLDGPAYYIAE